MPEEPKDERIDAFVKAMEVYHERHPQPVAVPVAAVTTSDVKTPLQRFLTHWGTLALTAAALVTGLFGAIVTGIDIKRNSDKVPSLQRDLQDAEQHVDDAVDGLSLRLADVDRLAAEAKEHRNDSEIHMSKEEKKLLFIEASKPLQDSINQVERSLDKLAIEQRESIKRQEKMAITLEKMLNK